MLKRLDSHVRPQQRHDPNKNLNTELFPGVAPAPLVDLHRAYKFARAACDLTTVAERGHRLLWVHRGAFASQTLRADEAAFSVVGRHTSCSMVVPEDPFVALRHLLVRSIALPSGGVALRVFDLHTDIGFVLPNGTRQTSIFAEGPVAIGIGDYALVALPCGEPLPDDMPEPAMHTPPKVKEQLEVLAQAMSPYRQNAIVNKRASRITLMPSLMMVGEPMAPSLGRLANGGSFAVTLARAGRTATVKLTEQELDCGVIIGRSTKCHSEELRRITEEGTSRVHLLILREGAIVYAYDLASTQGTYMMNGQAIRRCALPANGAMLTLGGTQQAVRLVWHQV